MPTKKLKRIIFIFTIVLLLATLFYNSFYFVNIYAHLLSTNLNKNVLVEGHLLKLKSNCSCKKSNLYVIKSFNRVYVQFGSTQKFYNFSDEEISTAKITCDLYNVLSRGPNQKVIGLSLYGDNPLYYESIEKIAQQARKYYPGWTLRIYYDPSSINETTICKYECLKENNEYLNNIDFCNVNKIPFGSTIQSWSAMHMHKMSWRWLPIVDSFVDYFMSRDTDAWVNEREHASVQVWLQSNTLFHIMRGEYLYFITLRFFSTFISLFKKIIRFIMYQCWVVYGAMQMLEIGHLVKKYFRLLLMNTFQVDT